MFSAQQLSCQNTKSCSNTIVYNIAVTLLYMSIRSFWRLIGPSCRSRSGCNSYISNSLDPKSSNFIKKVSNDVFGFADLSTCFYDSVATPCIEVVTNVAIALDSDLDMCLALCCMLCTAALRI